AWEQVLRRFQPEITPAWYERFLRPLRPASLEEGVATFAAPGRFVYEWVRERYAKKLQDALTDELGEPVTLRLVAESRERAATPIATAAASVAVTPTDSSKFKPFERYSFDSFVVGQSNRLAFAGAKAVATEPGVKYNPLFIYGASGLGKTHLLHAIAREILKTDSRFPLVYVSAQQFAEQFVTALQNNRIEQFRRAQRQVGVWLVDDIQFIAGKDKTQEEVFHTFNYLHSLGKQIVLSSDRPPRDLYLMDERLRSRFEAGLVADIQPPDTETRSAILLSKARHEEIDITTEIAMYLAENVPGNIRILEGALTKLAVQASVEGVPITVDLASMLVEQYYRTGTLQKPSFNQIVDTVGKHFKIGPDDIRGNSRKAPIVHARHISVYVTREITGDSWKHIGSLFGDRDHTSMMHAYQKISEMMVRDRELRSTVKMLIRNLWPEA
ncbi:MAG TPA: chromosomal replication initiator protein DnaA, partial [Fimbriimonadaceae bacterium]|nr:chromosomal replication initiator protein DnaA [Fimbriimonadaceae bacterium]